MSPRFFIIGDSHSTILRKAADRRGVACAGGFLAPGRFMNDHFFQIVEGRFELAGSDAALLLGANRRLAQYLAEAGNLKSLLDLDIPILSTVGFNSMNFLAMLELENFVVDPETSGWFISQACFEATIRGARRGALEFYRALRAHGKAVHAVPAPPRYPDKMAADISQRFDRFMQSELAEMGVGFVNVRAVTTNANGELLHKFESEKREDRQHANVAYGVVVIEKFMKMTGLSRGEAELAPAARVKMPPKQLPFYSRLRRKLRAALHQF